MVNMGEFQLELALYHTFKNIVGKNMGDEEML